MILKEETFTTRGKEISEKNDFEQVVKGKLIKSISL